MQNSKNLCNCSTAIYKGKEYLYNTYYYNLPNEYISLYNMDDTKKLNQLNEVTKNDIESYVNYMSSCEIDDTRYTALNILDNKFVEIRLYGANSTKLIKISDTTAVWTKRQIGKLSTNDIYYAKNKQVITDVIEAKYNYYLDFNSTTGAKLLVFCGDYYDLLNLQKSIKTLYKLRVRTDEILFEDVSEWSRFEVKIDNSLFELHLDGWGLVFLMPKNRNDNRYMVEILKYIRKYGIG